MEVFVVNTSRLVSDVIGGIAELKNTFHTEGQPINDDNVTLQKFCVKLETILRHQQKEKYTLLGIRKDYWNFITDVVSKDDGVKYVNMIPQMKTSQGKGRCFIRYALVKQTLADTIQRLLVSKSTLSSWYREDAILRNPSLSTALINKLYDLNGVEFDLPCAGYDLDISWPAFSRRTAKDGNSSGRRDSISSMTSVDFRNERRDPVIDLAAEVASLMEFFETEATGPREGKAKYDSISLTSASESPTINEITLQVSGIHKRALQWKADFVNERASTAHSLRKAQDDRQFAIQESELKTKQLMEKFSNLAKVASGESEKKIAVLTEALSKAESSLQERDSELRALRDEVNRSVVSTSTAHKSAIELEKQLMASERRRTELESEIENLNYKILSNEQSEGEFNDKEKRLKERVTLLEEKEMEYKELISELRGNLKAKEVALENIQASFEKLTGMVFGSFEELESNMKEKLVDKEKGLQNQTIENRKLELQVTDLRHQLEETKTALSEHKSKLNSTETSYKDIQSSNLELQQLLEDSNERLSLYASLLQELHHEAEGENNVNDVMSLNSKKEIQYYFQSLSSHIKDSKLKISQAQDLITANDKELANRQEDIQRLTDLIEQHKQQFNKLQNEAHENENVITSITTKLEEANNEIIRLINDNDDCKTTIDSIREEIKFLTEEKTSIEAQANIDKQQLEMANEGRIRAECAQIKAEEELKNVKCVMEQEVAALRFQLSSETMKFEEEIKVFSEQNRENVVNKERCLTLEETIADLESKLKERNNEWESEKRKFVNEIKRLRSQVQLLNNALEGNKQKKMSLENDLILTTKQLDEERARQKDIKQHVQDVEARKLESEKLLQGKIDEMGDDMKDLKNKIVSLTREKAELWQKAAEFEHELKLKATDRWVEDNEVNKCSSCKTEFSFLVRKHHCRLCGRIFCHSCANNWVRTAHSSKLKRVCNGCISKDQRLKPQEAPQRRNTEDEDFDDTMSDISFGASPRKNMSTSSIDVSDDEQTPSTSKTPTLKRDDLPSNAKSNKSARDAIIHDGGHESNDSFGNYEEFNKEKSDGSTSVDSTKVDSPQDVDYEFIDQNEEVGELPESRVVISNTDVKGELVIPAVNDEEGISRDFSVSPGTRYIVPVMVATPGAILCWSFKTVYKSVIFGLAYKQTESVSDDDIETLYPLARYSSNETPVEGEWKTSSHGVYVLVFDNSFSRFTSKQVSYVVHVKRRSSILKPS